MLFRSGDLRLWAAAFQQTGLGALQAHAVEDFPPAGAFRDQMPVQGAGVEPQGVGHLIAVGEGAAQRRLQVMTDAQRQAGGDAQGSQVPGGVLFKGAQLMRLGPARRAGEHVAVADPRGVGVVEVHRAAEQALVFPGLLGVAGAGMLEPDPLRVERLIVGELAGVTQPAGENGLHQMAPHRLAVAAGMPEYPRFIAAQPGFNAGQVARSE